MAILPLIAALAGAMGDPAAAFRAAGELSSLAGAPDALAAAHRALDARDYDRAAALAALASARAPESADAAMVVGLARFRGGLPELAVTPFRRAVAAAPRSATARFNLASALYQSGRVAEAEARYLEAAALDGKVAALATYDAALAAIDGERPDAAQAHLVAAEKAARAAHQDALADKAAALRRSLRRRASDRPREIYQLARAAKAALAAEHYDAAAEIYRRALATPVDGATAADRAELHYGLGLALWRDHAYAEAERAFAAAVALAPDDADFGRMLALSRAGAATQRDPPRFGVDTRVVAGYDTNAPQAGAVVVASQKRGEPSDAMLLEADLDLFARTLGTPRDGLSVDYRFGQLAYLSEALDPYSLQEHDLTVVGAWTPAPWLTLEAGADGYALFTGVRHFASFQAGASAGPRFTVREGHGLETRVRYQHLFKFSLDRMYDYLGGNRDEAGIAERWHDAHGRVALGYLFARENIGTELVPLAQLDFPNATAGSYPVNAIYHIPYSYFGHEISLAAARELPRDWRAQLTLRYEHRDYDGMSTIQAPGSSTIFFGHKRRDDRFGADVALRHPIGAGFDLEFAYTFIINRSTIDNTRAATPLDYDDKSYIKHVIQLSIIFVL